MVGIPELDKHTNIEAARFEASTIIRQTWPSLPTGLVIRFWNEPPGRERNASFMSYTLNAAATLYSISSNARGRPDKPRLSIQEF